jgi:hypothetical protein
LTKGWDIIQSPIKVRIRKEEKSMKKNPVLISLTIGLAVFAPLAAQTLSVNIGSIPCFDGKIDAGEWDDAQMVVLKNTETPDDSSLCYVKQNASFLWIGLIIPDQKNGIMVMVDGGNDKTETRDDNDFGMITAPHGGRSEYGGASWESRSPSGWEAMADTTGEVWSAEYKIEFEKLGLSAGTAKNIGVGLSAWNTAGGFGLTWPLGAVTNRPSAWGTFTSPDDWTGIQEPPSDMVSRVTVSPNPLRSSAFINTRGIQPGTILRIYSAEGRLVRAIGLSAEATPFDASDASGTPLPAGVYFYKADAPGREVTGSLVILD